MKRIFSTLSDKWPEYLLEILVITIGILGAFALNNWNENRKSENTEVKYLKELRNDLVETSTEINSDRELHLLALESSIICRDFMLFGEVYHDSLTGHFQKIRWDAQIYPKASAYESIKASGIDIITNDSIRIKITTFYQVILQDLIDLGRFQQGAQNFLNSFSPYEYKHFKLNSEPLASGLFPDSHVSFKLYNKDLVDLKALKADHEYLQKIQFAARVRNIIIQRLQAANQDCLNLIRLIDEELESKK